MTDHISSAYDADLAALKDLISAMGGIAEEQLAKAIQALVTNDVRIADQVVHADERLDAMETEVEEKAVLTIAKRQPVAQDLRNIMVAIRVASDLERTGDLAKNVAKRVRAVTGNVPRKLAIGLERMGQLAQKQLRMVLDAYAANDVDKALEVWLHDEDLDALYTSVFRELLTYMMEDPRMIGVCTHLLFATKNIERIGDHTTNVAENIYYLVKGKLLKDERPKRDSTSTMALNGNLED
jgi:phosphate transport system protein